MPSQRREDHYDFPHTTLASSTVMNRNKIQLLTFNMSGEDSANICTFYNITRTLNCYRCISVDKNDAERTCFDVGELTLYIFGE